MFSRKLLRCSFCGKDETEVSKLVAGPKVFICDVCTAAAARIIDSSSNDSSLPPAPQTPRWCSVLSRAWRLVRGRPLHRVAAALMMPPHRAVESNAFFLALCTYTRAPHRAR
jgi:hypothetical protein